MGVIQESPVVEKSFRSFLSTWHSWITDSVIMLSMVTSETHFFNSFFKAAWPFITSTTLCYFKRMVKTSRSLHKCTCICQLSIPQRLGNQSFFFKTAFNRRGYGEIYLMSSKLGLLPDFQLWLWALLTIIRKEK